MQFGTPQPWATYGQRLAKAITENDLGAINDLCSIYTVHPDLQISKLNNREFSDLVNFVNDGVHATQVPFIARINRELNKALISSGLFTEEGLSQKWRNVIANTKASDNTPAPRKRLQLYTLEFGRVTWGSARKTLTDVIHDPFFQPIAQKSQQLTIWRRLLKEEFTRRNPKSEIVLNHPDFRMPILEDLVANLHFKRCRSDIAFRLLSQEPKLDICEARTIVTDSELDRFVAHGMLPVLASDLELVLIGTDKPYLEKPRGELWFLDKYFTLEGKPGNRGLALKDEVWSIPSPTFTNEKTLKDLQTASIPKHDACPALVARDTDHHGSALLPNGHRKPQLRSVIDCHSSLYSIGILDPVIFDFSINFWRDYGLEGGSQSQHSRTISRSLN